MPTDRHAPAGQAGLSLVTMAVILTLLGAIIAGMLPMLMNRMESRSQSEAREIVRRVRDEVIGYAMANCNLPLDLATEQGIRSTGLGGSPLRYYRPHALAQGEDLNSDTSAFNVDVDGNTINDVAFMIVEQGRNKQWEHIPEDSAPTVAEGATIEVHTYSEGQDGQAFFDDVYETVTLSELKGYIQATCGSSTPAPVSLNGMNIVPNPNNGAEATFENEELTLTHDHTGNNQDGAVAAWAQLVDASGGSDICDDTYGICTLGAGLRAYFAFENNGNLHGFTFTVAGVENPDGYRLYSDTELEVYMVGDIGQGNGYAACNYDCAAANAAERLMAPKVGFEFDERASWNFRELEDGPQAGAATGDHDQDHMAILYWGEANRYEWNTDPRCPECTRNFCNPGYTAIYDDVIHGAGTGADPRCPNTPNPGYLEASSVFNPGGDGFGFHNLGGNYLRGEHTVRLELFWTDKTAGELKSLMWIDCQDEQGMQDLTEQFNEETCRFVEHTVTIPQQSLELRDYLHKVRTGWTMGTTHGGEVIIKDIDILFFQD